MRKLPIVIFLLSVVLLVAVPRVKPWFSAQILPLFLQVPLPPQPTPPIAPDISKTASEVSKTSPTLFPEDGLFKKSPPSYSSDAFEQLRKHKGDKGYSIYTYDNSSNFAKWKHDAAGDGIVDSLEPTLNTELQSRPSGKRSQEAYVIYVRICLTLIVGLAALFVILAKRYGPKDKHWGYATVGTIVGYWLKG